MFRKKVILPCVFVSDHAWYIFLHVGGVQICVIEEYTQFHPSHSLQEHATSLPEGSHNQYDNVELFII